MATGLKLLPALKQSPLGRPVALAMAALTFGLIVGLRAPLPLVILGLGTAGMALAWKRLKP
jgi:chromate transporter